MKGWIEVRVWADEKDKDPQDFHAEPLINVQITNISQVGSMNGHGYIKRVDGGDVETVEKREMLILLIEKYTTWEEQ